MIFYRECPNCHEPKPWRFTISIYILLTILGILPGIIYLACKISELKCEKCGFTTQMVILHDKGMQDNQKPRVDKPNKKKIKHSNLTFKQKWQNASDGNNDIVAQYEKEKRLKKWGK